MNHTSFPPELGLKIFHALDSLEDTLSLSATSRWLRAIWLEHADLIYRRVHSRSITGERYARALQLAISGNTKITANDATSIIHRAKFVESIMNQFNDKVTRNVRTCGFSSVYGNQLRPKQLTKTECRRFVRTYYQLWSIISLDEQQWQQTIPSLSIKQIYLLREMCWIPLPVGDDHPGPRMQQYFPVFEAYRQEGRRGRLGSVLQQTIDDYVKRKDSWYCDKYPWLICGETYGAGYAGFHLLWDHGKDALKQYCLGRPPERQHSLSEEKMEYERRHLWAESSDEEDGG